MDDRSTRKAMRVADLVVDVGARTVERDGRTIELPKTSFDFLVALIETSPDVLSTEQLLERVWKGRVVSPATIAKRVEMLRQSLGDEASDPRYIALVRGHGYRLLPEPEPIVRAPARTGRPQWMAAAVVVAAIALAAAFLIETDDPPPNHSIAVLPFSNLGPGEEGEHLSDGLATELTSLLTTIPDFKVAARTSAFAFKGHAEDVRTIGEQLGVSHILTGSVQLSGNRIRVSAQLVGTEDGYQIWSNSWERRMADIFGIQDEITSAVVRSLRIQLTDELPVSRRVDQVAYSYYLQGREAFFEDNEPDTGGDRDAVNTRALELATQALAIDPDFAAAWTLLARIHFNRAQWASHVRAEAFESATSAAKRALDIDPGAHRALTILGDIEDLWRWDSESAASSYRRALEISPGDFAAMKSVSVLLGKLDLPESAPNFAALAYERDPLNKTTAINLALVYWLRGQREAAWKQLEQARACAECGPGPIHRIPVQLPAGRLPRSSGAGRRCERDDPGLCIRTDGPIGGIAKLAASGHRARRFRLTRHCGDSRLPRRNRAGLRMAGTRRRQARMGHAVAAGAAAARAPARRPAVGGTARRDRHQRRRRHSRPDRT